jgi:hypothetical protein
LQLSKSAKSGIPRSLGTQIQGIYWRTSKCLISSNTCLKPCGGAKHKLIVHRLNFQHFEQSNMTRSSRWSECIIAAVKVSFALDNGVGSCASSDCGLWSCPVLLAFISRGKVGRNVVVTQSENRPLYTHPVTTRDRPSSDNPQSEERVRGWQLCFF